MVMDIGKIEQLTQTPVPIAEHVRVTAAYEGRLRRDAIEAAREREPKPTLDELMQEMFRLGWGSVRCDEISNYEGAKGWRVDFWYLGVCYLASCHGPSPRVAVEDVMTQAMKAREEGHTP
jgi:hypothetical protein